MNSSARRYIGMVKREIPWPVQQRKQLLRQLSQDAATYCEEDPDATPEILAQAFGDPKVIAADFLENLGGTAAIKTQRRNSLLRTAALVLLAVVVAAVAVRQLYVQRLLLDAGYIESVTQIVDEMPEEAGPTYYYEEFTGSPAAEGER